MLTLINNYDKRGQSGRVALARNAGGIMAKYAKHIMTIAAFFFLSTLWGVLFKKEAQASGSGGCDCICSCDSCYCV